MFVEAFALRYVNCRLFEVAKRPKNNIDSIN